MYGYSITFGIVSIWSVAGMFFSLIVSLLLPVIMFLYFWKKKNAKVSSFFIGAGTFFVFALILEQIIHAIVFAVTGDMITNNTWLLAIYGGLAAAVFEETGRIVSMKLFMKEKLNDENALMFGAGHGSIEAIIIIGLAEISNIASVIAINSGQMYGVLMALDEQTRETTYNQLKAIWETSSDLFFAAGIERIFTMGIHIGMTFFIYMGLRYSKKLCIALAYIFHFSVDAGSVILSKYISNTWLVELYVLAAAIVIIGAAYYMNKKLKNDVPDGEVPEETQYKI